MPDLHQFHAWWAQSYPGAPVNPQTAGICVAFAQHCLDQAKSEPTKNDDPYHDRAMPYF